MSRLRIDLDGIPLDDEDGRTTAIFRFRTTTAIHLSLPESVDVAVPLGDLAEAALDLIAGRVTLRFRPEAAPRYRWLGGARILVGAWTDRQLLTQPPRR